MNREKLKNALATLLSTAIASGVAYATYEIGGWLIGESNHVTPSDVAGKYVWAIILFAFAWVASFISIKTLAE